MGNAPSNPINQCLTSAVGGNSGLVAFPSKPFYQLTDVKPYNLNIPVSPIAVTYPQTSQHIAAIVKCAASSNLKVQARSGGHSYGNFGLGGGDTDTVVVDLKNLQQFSMDTNTWIATIGSGTQLGSVTSKLLSAGNRAMAHGTCPQVGIGGHATIGGLGPPSRMWGAALDHVVEVEVVLADSSIVTASQTQNSDVFWALKGAGASFGIITQFKVNTHPAPGETVQYSYTLSGGSLANSAAEFKKWQSLVSDPGLSRKFASQLVLTQIGMVISGTYFGSQEEFNAFNISSLFPQAVTSSSVVVTDWAGAVANWAEDLVLELGGGIPSSFYAKSLVFTPSSLMSDETINSLLQYVDNADKGNVLWFVIFDLAGGAVNDIPSDATAYAHRDALFYLQSYAAAVLQNVPDSSRKFLDGLSSLIQSALPQIQSNAYPGYVDLELGSGAQEDYWGSNLPRLQQIKSVVDPNDIFHNPQSVPRATN